ncbi:MAG: response regulator [Anaerolineae bacterium]|nr:response regulator [Anaerolineae bacterium]
MDQTVNPCSKLQECQQDLETQWLTAVRLLPGCATISADDALSCCRHLIQALQTDLPEEQEEKIRLWIEEQIREQRVSPSELQQLLESFAQIVRALLLPAETATLDGRLGAMERAAARWFAAEVEHLRAEKAHLEALNEIARELAASLDPKLMLHRVVAEVTRAIGGAMGAALLLDSTSGLVVPQATDRWEWGEDRAIPLSALPVEWQLGKAEAPLYLPDLREEPPQGWIKTLAGAEARALLVAPLIANGAFMGLLAVASVAPNAFRQSHIRLFNAVLSHIATAVGNAEIYHLITQQAQELGQMLRRQQEEATKSQAILSSIADGVVVNDIEGKTILVNPAAGRILDTPVDRLLGRDFRTLFSSFGGRGGEEAISAMEDMLKASESRVHKAFKTTLELNGRIVRAHLSPVLTSRSEFLGVVTILRDVTKEVEADRAKSEFVSTVSHELRTPMTSIKGYTDLLYAGVVGPLNDEQKRFLSIVRDNVERLTALINDLLDISRVESGRIRFEPKLIQLSDVIAEVVKVMVVSAEAKRQTLTYEVIGRIPEIIGDPDRLNQVVTNLVSNAIRYTPEGGKIEVKIYAVEGAVRVDVRDNGIGIAPDDLGHIFERFYRADHPLVMETTGTGLGLSIVKMFVEMHGGRVWVESKLGEGSTFTFILPVPVREQAEAEGRRVLPRIMARTRLIFFVEDDPETAAHVKELLEGNGYQVFVLGRGRPVVSKAEDRQPDLIILDLILPDVEGLEVLRWLRENPATADIPVIVMSIAQDDGSAWKLGIVDYLTKPVEDADILRSVERALTWQGRVLIVEDDADTVGLLSATMRQIGFTPLVAANGYEALAMARRYRPDLILLDLRLPGMDGYESLTHLKRDAITQTIPIVAISAHVADVEKERKRLIALGANSFLAKPFSIEDLLAEVEAALQPVAAPPPVAQIARPAPRSAS